MSKDKQAFHKSLLEHVGDEAGPFLGWDTVNRAMIRHWCESMGDKNPAYHDSDFSRDNGGIVAPPTMMMAWTMRGYAGEAPPGSDDREAMRVMDKVKAAGYVAVVAVNCEQDYFQPVREGDDLQSTTRIESISEEKQTALGDGYFVTQLTDYVNQKGETVGQMRFRVLLYKPRER